MTEHPALVGVDGGGTFTDVLVLYPGGTLRSFKVPSTPSQPADAILECLELAKLLPEAAIGSPDDAGSTTPSAPGRPRLDVSVGTTIATNTVLERKGARVAFVTTRGHSDMLGIGRQKRPGLYDPHKTKPPLLVPPELMLEIEERVNAAGDILVEPDNKACMELAAKLKENGAESVALCTLFSFLNPTNERNMAVHLSGFPLSVSSNLLPQMREYERASTTVLDAYVKPVIWHFVGELVARASTLPDEMMGMDDDDPDADGSGGYGEVDSSLGSAHLETEGKMVTPVSINLMRSNGGVAPIEDAITRPGELLLSGPAGGVLGAVFLSRLTGARNMLCLDMGGTSADISVIADGEAQWTGAGMVGPYPLALPMVEVVTIGTGGGSIARDDGGILSVGPESAGAQPGPMCYAMGGRDLTVTDANVCAGRIGPDTILGERVPVHPSIARDGMVELARTMDMTPDDTMSAILDVANTRMAHAARGVLSAKGLDPAEFTLLAFGGSGPLHACALADELEMDRVIVPPYPGVFSSLGILLAGVKYHFTSTIMATLDGTEGEKLDASLQDLVARAREQMASLEEPPRRGVMEFVGALRYQGQSFEINIPLDALNLGWDLDARSLGEIAPPVPGPGMTMELAERFHAEHQRLYGHRMDETPVEMVAVHLSCQSSRSGTGAAVNSLVQALRDGQKSRAGSSMMPKGRRRCMVGGQWEEVNIWGRPGLWSGWMGSGPMVIEEPLCTIFVDRGWQASVDPHGSIILNRVRPEEEAKGEVAQ